MPCTTDSPAPPPRPGRPPPRPLRSGAGTRPWPAAHGTGSPGPRRICAGVRGQLAHDPAAEPGPGSQVTRAPRPLSAPRRWRPAAPAWSAAPPARSRYRQGPCCGPRPSWPQPYSPFTRASANAAPGSGFAHRGDEHLSRREPGPHRLVARLRGQGPGSRRTGGSTVQAWSAGQPRPPGRDQDHLILGFRPGAQHRISCPCRDFLTLGCRCAPSPRDLAKSEAAERRPPPPRGPSAEASANPARPARILSASPRRTRRSAGGTPAASRTAAPSHKSRFGCRRKQHELASPTGWPRGTRRAPSRIRPGSSPHIQVTGLSLRLRPHWEYVAMPLTTGRALNMPGQARARPAIIEKGVHNALPSASWAWVPSLLDLIQLPGRCAARTPAG